MRRVVPAEVCLTPLFVNGGTFAGVGSGLGFVFCDLRGRGVRCGRMDEVGEGDLGGEFHQGIIVKIFIAGST